MSKERDERRRLTSELLGGGPLTPEELAGDYVVRGTKQPHQPPPAPQDGATGQGTGEEEGSTAEARSEALREAVRWKAQASAWAENIKALTKERDALQVDVNALRRCYFWLADDQGIEPVCDEYDAAGPGAGVEEDGYPQCAACGHPKVAHEQAVGGKLLSLLTYARAWADAIERVDGIAAAEQELLKAVKDLG